MGGDQQHGAGLRLGYELIGTAPEFLVPNRTTYDLCSEFCHVSICGI